ncbi:MAG: hypothetical protein K2W95_29065 [Candidatus Obscuribacterales bacterium]|nr:hypothetical protein [Candidatus Obscuribacterales bacterium]
MTDTVHTQNPEEKIYSEAIKDVPAATVMLMEEYLRCSDKEFSQLASKLVKTSKDSPLPDVYLSAERERIKAVYIDNGTVSDSLLFKERNGYLPKSKPLENHKLEQMAVRFNHLLHENQTFRNYYQDTSDAGNSGVEAAHALNNVTALLSQEDRFSVLKRAEQINNELKKEHAIPILRLAFNDIDNDGVARELTKMKITKSTGSPPVARGYRAAYEFVDIYDWGSVDRRAK